MGFDPLKLAKREDREQRDRQGYDLWCVVDPEVMYPAVLAAIQEGKQKPTEERHQLLVAQARGMTQALADALLPAGVREETASEEVTRGGKLLKRRDVKVKIPVPPAETLPAERRAARANVLEIARLWFTNELHHAIEQTPMGVHILKNVRWKL